MLSKEELKLFWQESELDITKFAEKVWKAAVVAEREKQAEQEPVGVVTKDSLDGIVKWSGWIPREGTKLYAAPIRTKDLTDDEIERSYSNGKSICGCHKHGLRAVIAADREKNK